MKNIAIVACCDTKYHEVTYVKNLVKEFGHNPIIVDISLGRSVPMETEVSRDVVLKEGGYDVEEVIGKFSKSDAIAAMSKSIRVTIPRLHKEGRIDAVFGMGGLQNTIMCSAAFTQLPLGFPKMIVSTIASGSRDFDLVVGDKDITVVPSIVDFCGINALSCTILKNAISAVVGMVEHGEKEVRTEGHTIIGATLMGITNDTVMDATEQLTAQGREVICFHSTGLGGKVMEQMIASGQIKAVMDLSLHELTAEYFGGKGACQGAYNRLSAGAEAGTPMLIVPGAIDCISLRPNELFEDEEQRGHLWHNPTLSHTRLYENEILDITHIIVERLNKAKGRVKLLLPMDGLRTMSYEGQLFHKPETIQKMKEIFEKDLKKEIEFKAVPYNFMDKEFADLVVREMNELLKELD